MKIKIIVHEAEEGGYWAEVPALQGCFTQAETWQELIKNIYEAIECHISAMEEESHKIPDSINQIIEIAI
ncbi:MAG: type II toxin-antitoxin system HicB family antitoxin [Candidatus Poribacteria bacterium]